MTLAPYEAVILRYHPIPQTGERLNVGVVVFSPAVQRVASRFTTRSQRLTDAFHLGLGGVE